MSRPVTGKHRLEYAGFVVLRTVLRILPESLALGVGEALGLLAGSAFRIRRRVVDANLALAFPEADRRWRARVARGCFRHLGREAAALFRLGSRSPQWVRDATEVEGLEALRDALAEGRGVVVVTGHLGSWEMGGAALTTRGIALEPVALVQANPLFDRELTATRERFGLRLILRGHAPKEVMRSLRRGRAPALVADQNARHASVFIDFFGVPAATFRGPALFALRSGAPLFHAVCLRTSRHPQRYRLVLEEVAIEATGDLEHDVGVVTKAHVALLERWIRRAPDQYFWQHKRWKTRPPDDPPGNAEG